MKIKKITQFAAVLGSVLVLLSETAALAQTPSNAYFYFRTSQSGRGDQPQGRHLEQLCSLGGTEAATGTPSYDPYVSASATGGSSFSASVTSEYIFYFEILGVANGTVPILVSANGAATTTGNGTVRSTFAVGGNTFGIMSPGSYSVDQNINLNPSQIYSATLDTTASAAIGNNNTSSSYVDPIISIDPTFLNANPGASIQFSPNFGPVPEPSSVALIAVALGAGAIWLVRRKSVQS